MTRRPTLLDVAQRAGTSKTVASYALNGTGRVSPATRARVLAAAESLGWQPNTAARSLSALRSETVGLLLVRQDPSARAEPFLVHFMTGAETMLSSRGYMLLLHGVPDHNAACETYRRWWAQRRVDGVLILDLIVNDPRIPLAEELHLPAVAVGAAVPSTAVRSVTSGAPAALETVIDYLAASGHRRLGWVGGDRHYEQTRLREAALRAAAERRGVEAFHVRWTDSSAQHGARATRELLSLADRPTAVLYNNDVMAAAALGVIREMGLRVPEDVSIIAGEDTELCRLVHPQLTALSRDIEVAGKLAAAALLDALAGEPPSTYRLPAPELMVRASTAAMPPGA